MRAPLNSSEPTQPELQYPGGSAASPPWRLTLRRASPWFSPGPTAEHTHTPVVQAEAEPPCSVVEGSQRELELRVSAVCDYAKFSCDGESVPFKDTMLYQTRVSQ